MSVDLSEVNYILLKEDGSILEQKVEYYIEQGNTGADKIFFGSLAAQSGDVGIAAFTLPNGQQNTLQGTFDDCVFKIDGVDTIINGFLFTLTTDQTNYNGGLMVSLGIFRNSKRYVTYPLYLVINETGLRNDTDTGITIEEINSYLQYVRNTLQVTDGILVISSLNAVTDWRDYAEGQLFLTKDTGEFYIRTNGTPYFALYEIDYVHKKTTSGLFAYTHLGSTQSEMPISTPATGDTIAKRESDGRLKVATPSSDGDATTKKYVDDRVDKIIVVSGNTTLDDPSILEEPNIRIYNSTSKFFYEKAYDRNSYYVFQCAYIGYKTDVNDYSRIVRHFCTAIKSTGVLEFADGSIIDTYDKSQTDSKFYNKTQVDNLLTTIKQNEIQVVSSLPSNGEEGIIYLVPINPQDLTKGYYRYIWENNAWLSLGTTEIDLSNYYNKTETNTLLNGKVKKVGSPRKVYGTGDNGSQTVYGIDSDETGDGDIVRRDENGRIYAQNPVANGQVATKQYVDNSEQSAKDYADSQIATAVSRVYRYIGTLTVAQINALSTSSLTIGDVYNVSDSGTLTLGNVQVISGDNVAWSGTAWDKLANDINWEEYNEKFIAAGFFEVQDYDQSTGEITFVFATDLYDMSYDSNTGIMSIEAN